MTTTGAGYVTRRVDRCVLVGDVPFLPVVPEGWVAVLVDPALPEAPGDLEVSGTDEILLLAPGGEQLAERLGRPVFAPDGPVVQTPGGILFTAGTAFWQHRPGRVPVAAGPRWPAPDWQSQVPAQLPWPDAVIAQPVPSGWLISPGPIGAAPALDGIEFAVAVDPSRPRLLLDAALTPDLLAAAMSALPTRVRRIVDLVPLATGQGAGRVLAAAAANHLGEPIHLVNGVPLHTAGGTITVFALDAHRRPVWAEPAWLLRVTPDGEEEVLASSPPQPTLRQLDPATYAMDLGWQVRLSGGGIHAVPGPPPPPAKGRASLPDPAGIVIELTVSGLVPSGGGPSAAASSAAPPFSASPSAPATSAFSSASAPAAFSPSAPPSSGSSTGGPPTGGPLGAGAPGGAYRIVVGVPGAPVEDLAWPPLSAMFTALLADIPAPVDLVVAGDTTGWGTAAARELAERHVGVSAAGGPPKDYLQADLVPMPAPPSEPDEPALTPAAATSRILLVAAAVAAVLLLVGGVVTFWPRDSGGTSLTAGGTDPRTATVPGAAPPAASATASTSTSPSAKTSASASARPSGSTSVVPSGPPSTSAGPTPSASSTLPLATGADVALGRPTAESSHAQGYDSGRVADGDPSSYWEGGGALPHWVQVDLGTPTDVRRVVLRLPPSPSWPYRTQNVTVMGSGNGSSFSNLTSTTCSFDPQAGQRCTINLSTGPQRYLRIVFRSNSVQNAGQLSSFEVYRT